jgi:hypothetical protein
VRTVNLTLAIFLLVSLLGIGLIGCAEPKIKSEDIQGTWMAIAREPSIPGRSGQVGFVIEFFGDNTVMLPSGKRTWSILEDGRVKIDDPGVLMHGSLKEGILSITMSDETKIMFKKQK